MSRTVQEIKETGAAWVSESELDYLCNSFLEFEAENERLRTEHHAILTDARERYAADIGKLEEERDRLRAALERMGKDGCGLIAGNACSEAYPDDVERWCWSCQAIEALKGGDDAE